MARLFRGRGQLKTHTQPATQASPTPTEQGATQVLPETMWADEPMPSGIPTEESVVVTISRQFGSGGAEVGRLLAQNTDLNYVDHTIIDEVARRLGVGLEQATRQDEQTRGHVGHILEAIQSSTPFAINYGTLLGMPSLLGQAGEIAYLRLTQKVLLETATEGNAVIVGRGAAFLLHNSPRTLHTYIFAPLPYRIENVMKHFQLDRAAAIQLIEQRDYLQDAYLRRYYGSDGHQPSFYHLLINTGLFPFELAADLIRQALPLAKKIGMAQ